jgi:predicted nuclease with TOPRIM domain
MIDGKVNLEFLGEQMLRMQVDLRGVRSEQLKLESEQATMQAEMAGMRGDVAKLAGGMESLDDRVGRIETKVEHVDTKLDNLAASVDARFDQVNETMATNLDIVLKAIDAKRT